MIAELVREYDTLKKCGIKIPDPCFAELGVSIEIIVRHDNSVRVEWCETASDGTKLPRQKAKPQPLKDIDCPVTEWSGTRSSGNNSPHGLVDNCSWLFGQLVPESKKASERSRRKPTKSHAKRNKSPGEARRLSYLRQLDELYAVNPSALREIDMIRHILSDEKKREGVWEAVEDLLKEHVVDGKKNRLFETNKEKWRQKAAKVNIRWVVEGMGRCGRPVNVLPHVKEAWRTLQAKKMNWWITSLIDGQPRPARLLHPQFKGNAGLISFNNPATYCGHLSPEYRKKPGAKKGKDPDGSALPAQVGFEEADKYARALEWLIDSSSVKFGDSVNCIWIDQSTSQGQQLDHSGHECLRPHAQPSIFKRGTARGRKGRVLADTGDLLQTLRRYRNGQKTGHRNKRFYLLSLLLRRKGRHAITGTYTGTMGLLDDNTDCFVEHTKILIPSGYLGKRDEAREFCPTLMDVLSAAGIKSEKKQRLVWDREVVEVIVAGHPLPADLCRLVIRKAIKNKHREQSPKTRVDYLTLLAMAAGCARHYLTATLGKKRYGMGLDTSITEPGYLAGRLFALCENVQKRGRSWGPTLSDKLFSSAAGLPRQTLVELYQNCLCYKDKIHREVADWFNEIFEKIAFEDTSAQRGAVMPENGVDEFAFLLGYWHQRSKLGKTTKTSNSGKNAESKTTDETERA